jgi:uncharacterized protein (DUF1499 family)
VPIRVGPPDRRTASEIKGPSPIAATGWKPGAGHIANLDIRALMARSPALRKMRNLVPRLRYQVAWLLLLSACYTTGAAGPPTETEFRQLLALGDGSNVAVTSDGASDPRLRPGTFAGPPEQVRSRVLQAIGTLSRWRVAGQNGPVVWATRTTRLFRFVDDLFVLVERRGDSSVVLVRSASRVGKDDLGQNRRNIAELWAALARSR